MKNPRFIRVNADLYELQEETVPQNPEGYFVEKDVEALLALQNKFVSGAKQLLPQCFDQAFELLGPPIKDLLTTVVTISTRLRSWPRMFKFDTPSEQFYAFEASRWGIIDTLLSFAIQLSQKDMDASSVDNLTNTAKSLVSLKERHKKAFQNAHNNTTRTVTADFDPDATKPIALEHTEKAKIEEAEKPKLKHRKGEEMNSAIAELLSAAKDLAQASVDTLNLYDSAAESIASAHAFIKSAQIGNIKFGQVIKFAGATYRAIE